MSYLQLMDAPLPDMNKGIISMWFRDIRKGTPPGEKEWPSGLWESGTDSMLPPDTLGMMKTGGYEHNVFYWDAYGMPISALGVSLGLLGPAAVCIPTPPPFITNDMHMMLTFGIPGQSYDYYPWVLQGPAVIEAVQYISQVFPGPIATVKDWPPPYAPWIKDYGKFKPLILKLAGSPMSIADYVPQSFIGVDKDGYLTICLQTDTRGKDNDIYKGWAFQLDKMHEIWATLSYFEAPPHLALGSGHWVKVPGYWDGYEFEYTDISNEVMGAAPEYFVIGGGPTLLDFFTIPPVNDGAWHHLLFSFDISGSVSLERPSRPPGTIGGPLPPPIVSTTCKAWLALDDHNYDGDPLQHRFPMHDGITSPLLPGMGTDVIGFGPVTCATRSALNLDPNGILPRNCWIIPIRGNPKDNLLRFTSSSGTWDRESTEFIEKGDYNYFRWTAGIWTLYHSGDWKGELDPPRPSTRDPATFDPPSYNCSSFTIPVANYPIGIPTSMHHVDHNTGIEMAELQIWAGQTLDTKVESNRRLFIAPNVSGAKVPVPPSVAAKALGRPHILLHGSGNWQHGTNTGSTGRTDTGETIASGQFENVGVIEKFKPDPKLGR